MLTFFHPKVSHFFTSCLLRISFFAFSLHEPFYYFFLFSLTLYYQLTLFRYKEELTADQKQEIKILIREKHHPKIAAEITRELTHSKCRGEIPSEMEVM